MTISTLPDDVLQDWNERKVIKVDGKLQDTEGNVIDLGFFRRVEQITGKVSRQDFADQALFSRMKIMQTNVDISDLWKHVDKSIERI